MPSPAIYLDIEARWRPLSSEEQNVASTLLEDAWRLLRRVDGLADLEARIDADSELRAEVVRVLSLAVKRVLLNPDGKQIEQIDDYSYTRDKSTAAGELYFTDEEVAGLLPADAPRRLGAFAVDLAVPHDGFNSLHDTRPDLCLQWDWHYGSDYV